MGISVASRPLPRPARPASPGLVLTGFIAGVAAQLQQPALWPAWGYAAAGSKPRLSEDQIRAVAVYVHALGGGE